MNKNVVFQKNLLFHSFNPLKIKSASNAISPNDSPSKMIRIVRLGFSEIANSDINSDIRAKIPKTNNPAVSNTKSANNPAWGTSPAINRSRHAKPANRKSIISEIVQRAVNTVVAVLPRRIFIKRRNTAGKISETNKIA